VLTGLQLRYRTRYIWHMNERRYRLVLYFITLVMLITLGIQGYWNYKNYQIGKQQLVNDMQTSLDNAVSNYYTDLAKGNIFTQTSGDSLSIFMSKTVNDEPVWSDSIHANGHAKIYTQRSLNFPSIFGSTQNDSTFPSLIDRLVTNIRDSTNPGSLEDWMRPVDMLSSKIIVSFAQDSLSLVSIDSLLQQELNRKNISVVYGLSIEGPFVGNDQLRPLVVQKSKLSAKTKSPFFINESTLAVHFKNITLSVLKKNILGILLSLLLIGGVLGCLLYLLKIIRQQKQLAEVKNDLISNITHFKTPLATIGVAMEGISQYNAENDAEKNLRYAKISGDQVIKLNTMVEKLLETATLDSEKLQLNFEKVNLVDVLRKSTLTENLVLENKTIDFSTSEETILKKVDVFHFENAINNIIDNAIKYGGEYISASIRKHDNTVEISISDSGQGISEGDKKQIFEKFYRVPKGNTHDVKGFGIGLYYTKKIVEKHQGKISVTTNGKTTFKIILPYE